MQIVLVLDGEVVNKSVDDHLALVLENLLHALLIRSELGFSCLLVDVKVTVVSIPLVFLLGLNLLLDELDHESGQRVLVHVLKKTVKDLALSVKEQVLKRHLLLLVEQLVHDLGEVSAKNGERFSILVEELGNHV